MTNLPVRERRWVRLPFQKNVIHVNSYNLQVDELREEVITPLSLKACNIFGTAQITIAKCLPTRLQMSPSSSIFIAQHDKQENKQR